MTETISVIMLFSIPLTAILTRHFQRQMKMKRSMLQDELELERIKQQNYLIETEKMKLELEQMKIGSALDITLKN